MQLEITEHLPAPPTANDDAGMFDLAPVSLWAEDYSALKTLFAQWRSAGVSNLRQYLKADPQRVTLCSQSIHLLKVNQRTLALYEAKDLTELTDNLDKVFRADMLAAHIEELAQLWDGNLTFTSISVNYALSGRRIDIRLNGRILPGYETDWARVLIAIEDITAEEQIKRQLAASESYARALFAQSPVSLWAEDFSSIKKLLDDVRFAGISDFRIFTDVHPEFVERCMAEIRVIDVNQHTLTLFGAPDKSSLLSRLGDIFRDDMRPHFNEQLIELWDGKLQQQREVVNYALNGEPLNLVLQFSVMPGYERDWSLVVVALTDITARKKAEAYLEFLGRHDVLTRLYNRSYYVEEINRLERRGPFPVTIIMADLDGLKAVNDEFGHAAGDALLRRAGEVLLEAVDKPYCAARIGGDEFAILLPGSEQAEGDKIIEQIEKLIEINNQFYSAHILQLSIGMATCTTQGKLEATIRQADSLMYQAKRARYAASPPASPLNHPALS